MGILDFFGGGDQQPAQDPSFSALRELGLPEGLLDAYQKEQEQNRRMQAMQMVIGGIGNAVSGYQGMAPVAAPSIGASGGAGGGSGGIGGIDGLVDRAMKFSQLREGIAKQRQMAEARAALPEIARQLGMDPKIAAGMIDQLPAMMKSRQDADFNAQAEVRKVQETAKAAGVTDPAEIQKLIQRQFQQNPEIKEVTLPNGEKMSVQVMPDRTVRDLSGNAIAPNVLQGGAGPSKTQKEGEDNLRKEIEGSKQVQDYAAADPMYRSMVQSALNPNGASDLDLIYGFGKIMDPGSVVREGELVLVQGSGDMQDRLRQLIQSVSGGGKLTPEVRMNLLKTAQTRLGELRTAYDDVVGTRSEIAKRRGLGVENIVTRNFGDIPQVPDLVNPQRQQTNIPYTNFSTAAPVMPGQPFVPDPAAALRELQRRLAQKGQP